MANGLGLVLAQGMPLGQLRVRRVVEVGDSVTYGNSSSGDFWVASIPHPVHTDLPGFDAKQPIPPRGELAIAFDEGGEWGYHNHLKPSQGGTVVVQ